MFLYDVIHAQRYPTFGCHPPLPCYMPVIMTHSYHTFCLPPYIQYLGPMAPPHPFPLYFLVGWLCETRLFD